MTLGQGHQKVIQYIFPDLYFLLTFGQTVLTWEAKAIAVAADAEAAAETN